MKGVALHEERTAGPGAALAAPHCYSAQPSRPTTGGTCGTPSTHTLQPPMRPTMADMPAYQEGLQLAGFGPPGRRDPNIFQSWCVFFFMGQLSLPRDATAMCDRPATPT